MDKAGNIDNDKGSRGAAGDEDGARAFIAQVKEEVEAGNVGNDQGIRGAAGDEDGARAFIAEVKEEVERCLEAGMSKEQMFKELRDKGLHPAAAFAVYKELRDQNNDRFKEYYLKMDVGKQAERLKLLLHKYRIVRDAHADAMSTTS